MPDDRSDDEHPEVTPPEGAKSYPPLQRSRFGGTERRFKHGSDGDVPVSRSDLSKGPEEVSEHRSASISGVFF